MSNIIIALLAKFINADTIGGYVRAAVAAGVSALLAWTGSWILPFVSAEMQTAITAALTAFIVGLWAQIAKQTTAPTQTQVVNVIKDAADKGIVTQATAAKIKADPTIAMPDKAVGNL